MKMLIADDNPLVVIQIIHRRIFFDQTYDRR